MAWRCSGTTNDELISNLKAAGLIEAQRVEQAMRAVDRAHYCPRSSTLAAYEDAPQPIGHGATISAPHMHSNACEALLPRLKPGARVLDVGSGSGYLLGILHALVAPGTVIGIDHIPELVEESIRSLRSDGHGAALDDGSIKVICGDGRQGWAEGGPYDAIHVGAAAPVLPETLVDQLASPGRLFIPVGDMDQYIWQIDKDEHGQVTRRKLYGVRYVPLTGR